MIHVTAYLWAQLQECSILEAIEHSDRVLNGSLWSSPIIISSSSFPLRSDYFLLG